MTLPHDAADPTKRPIPVAPTEERWRAMTQKERVKLIEEVIDVLNEHQLAMPEGRPHSRAKSRAIDMLSRHFRAMGRRIYLAEDMAVLYPGEPSFSPDVFAVLDVEDPEDDERMAWVVADEGKGLDWVLEVLVHGDRKKDLVLNVERYAALGITEYFIYDRARQRLLGYRLAPGSRKYQMLVPQAGLHASSVLGLDLAIVEGRLRFYQGTAELYDTAHVLRRLEGIVENLEARVVEAEARAEKERLDAEQARTSLRQAIKMNLDKRGITCSAEGLARIEACDDTSTLAAWLGRALVAASEAELFSS